MNMKHVWGMAGGFFLVYILITLTNRPQATSHESAAPNAPETAASSAVAGGPATSASGAPLNVMRGFTALSVDDATYGAALEPVLERIQRAGGEWVSLGPVFFVDMYNTPSVSADARKTASPERIADAIERCHAHGLKVMVRPVVVSRDGHPTLMIAPVIHQLTIWFGSYAETLSPYFAAAEGAKAEVFCLAAGLPLMDRNLPWVQLIDKARANYHGLLTYGALAVDYPNLGGYRQVTFWKQLDFIGIEGYLPSTDWATFARDLDQFRASEGLQTPLLLTNLSPNPQPVIETNGEVAPSPNVAAQPGEARALVNALFSRPDFRGAFLGEAVEMPSTPSAFAPEALGVLSQAWGAKPL